MTELSFLIDLLINPRDSEQLKKDLAARIKEVEQTLTTKPVNIPFPTPILSQAPSTLAAMAKHVDALPPEAFVPPAPQSAQETLARQNAIELIKRGKNKPLSTR